MEGKSSRVPKVLFIEDNPGYQCILQIYLKRAVATCECCYDGRTSLKKLLDNAYGLSFMDINNSKLDNFALAARRTGKNDTTPLIAITAINIEGLRKILYKIGFNDFFQKPLIEDQITKIIQQYVCEKM